MRKMLIALSALFMAAQLHAESIQYDSGILHEKNLWLNSTQPGKLGNYLLYVPESSSRLGAEQKLLVMLHGCTQKGLDFFEGTRIRKFADKMGFLVLLPQQSDQSNPYNCWNWVLPSNQIKAGPMMPNEPRIILEAIDQVRVKYGIRDGKDIFMAGMSAGAAMANIIATCYPQRVNAIALSHGVQYAAAAYTWWDVEGLKELGVKGSSVDPEVTAYAGYACAASGLFNPFEILGESVPAIIFHGDSGIMTYKHSEQTEQQLLAYSDYLDNGFRDGSLELSLKSKKVNPSAAGKYSYEIFSSFQKDELLIERYKVQGLGHAWSGGDSAFGYFDEKGPDATALMIKFFKRFGL